MLVLIRNVIIILSLKTQRHAYALLEHIMLQNLNFNMPSAVLARNLPIYIFMANLYCSNSNKKVLLVPSELRDEIKPNTS